MSEIPMYPNECGHRREPEWCAECLRHQRSLAEARGDRWKQIATEMREERDRLQEALNLILAVSDDDPILKTASEALAGGEKR